MEKIVICLVAVVAVAHAGLVSHDVDHGEHKATSYQSIKFEHYHAVPTYVKKEDAHLLKHPVSVGHTGAKLQVHHGGKHDHGYAIADQSSKIQHGGHGYSDEYAHTYEAHDYKQPEHSVEDHEHHYVLQKEPESHGHHEYAIHQPQEEEHGHYENIDYEQLKAALLKQKASQSHGYGDNAGLGLGHYH